MTTRDGERWATPFVRKAGERSKSMRQTQLSGDNTRRSKSRKDVAKTIVLANDCEGGNGDERDKVD